MFFDSVVSVPLSKSAGRPTCCRGEVSFIDFVVEATMVANWECNDDLSYRVSLSICALFFVLIPHETFLIPSTTMRVVLSVVSAEWTIFLL